MPIPCADVIVVSGKRFLLVKRKTKPLRGTWCFVGGRVVKGEKLREAAVRKVREEVGIPSIKIKKFLASEETFFEKSAWGSSTHTINSVFLAEAPSAAAVRFDATATDAKWFSKIDQRWPAYVKKMLHLAGFK